MKRFFVSMFGAVILAALTLTGYAANGRGNAKLTLNGKMVSIEYGTPSLNGRTVQDLLGQLQAGEVWRLGADKSTTFSTSAPLRFGEVAIPKGEYSLWVRKVSEGSWELVFNKQHGQWGTAHDAGQDFAAVPLNVEKEEKPADKVEVNLENEKGAGEISIAWGTMELTTTFK